jgi:type II secretory pathway predicted ATPase ExeA
MDRFRFVTVPFTREINIEHRFHAEFIESEIKSLTEIVEARQSAAIVAPAGTGKSLVLRALRGSLPEARYRVIYLKLANLSVRDMCRQIAVGLGLPSAGHFPSLVKHLEEKFRAGYETQGLRQVLLFDDAHEMRYEAIRLVRLLTNYDMDSKLVVSIILCGQGPLKQKILTSEMEDIRQRLNHCSELRLLTREETKDYIEHRVKIAGAAKSPFSNDAIQALFEITHGNMRALDKMATASLKAADAAGRAAVSASDVASARSGQWM